MILWFAGLALVAVWLIFRDPAIDYRLVVVGALLPDAIDAPFGGARVMHTMVASAGLLVLVMLATRRRRRARRRLLAVPIGVMLHLVLDGAWADSQVLWWPFQGSSFDDAALPSAERGWLLVPMEVAGAVAIAWFWTTFGLSDATRRRRFLRTGRLPA